MSQFSDEIKKVFADSDKIRDEGLCTPDDVIRWDDIVYGESAPCQILDLYKPLKETDMILPVILSVHGGGWVAGSKETYQFYCMSLAQRGFAVVNFTYRLAPENKFPCVMEDCNLVIAWIFENAEKYGLDTKNIFCVGDSAGAYHLSMYSAICTNSDYAERFAFRVPYGFVPTAIALNCGQYGFEMNENTEDFISKLLLEYRNGVGDQEENELILPVDFITPSFPPVYIMTATGDYMIDKQDILIQKLRENRVPFLFGFYGDSEHELGHVFHLNIRLKEAEECNQNECDFFMKHYIKPE